MLTNTTATPQRNQTEIQGKNNHKLQTLRHYNRYIFTYFFQDLIDYEAKVDSYKNGNPHAKIVRWVDKAFKTLKQSQVGSVGFSGKFLEIKPY